MLAKEKVFNYLVENFPNEFTNKELSEMFGIKLGTVSSLISYLHNCHTSFLKNHQI